MCVLCCYMFFIQDIWHNEQGFLLHTLIWTSENELRNQRSLFENLRYWKCLLDGTGIAIRMYGFWFFTGIHFHCSQESENQEICWMEQNSSLINYLGKSHLEEVDSIKGRPHDKISLSHTHTHPHIHTHMCCVISNPYLCRKVKNTLSASLSFVPSHLMPLGFLPKKSNDQKEWNELRSSLRFPQHLV